MPENAIAILLVLVGLPVFCSIVFYNIGKAQADQARYPRHARVSIGPLSGSHLKGTMPVILYSQPNCAPCRAVSAKLAREGIPFETIDITQDPVAAAMLRTAGFTGTPVLHHAGALHSIAGMVGIVTAHREAS